MRRIDRALAAVFQPIGRAVLLNRNAAACRNSQIRRTVDRRLIADLTAVRVRFACPANNVLGIEEIPTNVQNTYSKFLMPYLIKIYHLL